MPRNGAARQLARGTTGDATRRRARKASKQQERARGRGRGRRGSGKPRYFVMFFSNVRATASSVLEWPNLSVTPVGTADYRPVGLLGAVQRVGLMVES